MDLDPKHCMPPRLILSPVLPAGDNDIVRTSWQLHFEIRLKKGNRMKFLKKIISHGPKAGKYDELKIRKTSFHENFYQHCQNYFQRLSLFCSCGIFSPPASSFQ